MTHLTLQNIRQKLPDLIKKLEDITLNSISPKQIRISGLNGFREAINELVSWEVFSDQLINLLNSKIYNSNNDSLLISDDVSFESFKNEITLLVMYLSSYEKLLRRNLPIQSIDSINIKLPDLTNFNDLSKISKDLHSAISQIVMNDDIKGKEEIMSVENGSIWINVLVGAGGVGLISGVVWSASVIYNFISKFKHTEEHLRQISIQGEALENIRNLQENQIKLLIEAEARYLQSEHFRENEPENIERLKNSIKIFSELLLKGAEVKPALMAPEEVTNLFPSVPELVESKAVKKIDKE